MADRELYKLLAWFSPAMPTGAFSYSHGLEWAVEDGLVHDADTLHAYITAALREGSGRLDASLLCAACTAEDPAALEPVTELAAAMRGTCELALESGAQGRALLTALRRAWPAPALDDLAVLAGRLDVEPPHAVVAGVAAAAHGLPLQHALIAFLHGLAANLVSAGVRLIPLGQSEGQRLTAALGEVVEAVAEKAMTTPLDELGTATPMIDWCSVRHETQRTRLFRS
ncbi:MAG TPA: urease accessory UreF family protein [Geminicoccaceae bacterium]